MVKLLPSRFFQVLHCRPISHHATGETPDGHKTGEPHLLFINKTFPRYLAERTI